MLVLHFTALDFEDSLKVLCEQNPDDPDKSVSCHYLIREDGEIYGLVPENLRAWHAGKSRWKGMEDVNSASVGIELVHEGYDPAGSMRGYPEAQMESLVELSADIISRHGIAPPLVVGHSDVAPCRKIDPGALDWKALAERGIGVWPPDSLPRVDLPEMRTGDVSEDVATLQRNLSAHGYGIRIDNVFGRETEFAVAAFQRHFRHGNISGSADRETIERLSWLVGRSVSPNAPGFSIPDRAKNKPAPLR